MAAEKDPYHPVIRWGRRIGIAIAGTAVLTVGILMIVLPGPAFVVIPLGLGILSLEFERPRIWLAYLKERAKKVAKQAREKLGHPHQD